MSTKTVVIYHRADFDGIFCREISRKFLPDAELIGWDYGDPTIPTPEGKIYILDLSPECVFVKGAEPSPEVWTGLWERMIWIDHHKSAIEKYPLSLPGYRIDGVAACRLAWQWFSVQQRREKTPCCSYETRADVPYPIFWNPFNKVMQCHNCGEVALPEGKGQFYDRLVQEPLAVRLAGEYDIWDKRDPNAELFQHGLRSRDLTDSDWRILLGNPRHPSIDEIERMMDVGHPFQLRPDGTCDESLGTVEGLLNGGRVVQYAKTQESESIIKAAGFTIQFEGLTFLAVNHARYNSHLFTTGLKPGHDACFGFCWRDGQWVVSLYHAPGKEHHDLSLIAVKYGGGGHRGACGFRVNSLPFLNA